MPYGIELLRLNNMFGQPTSPSRGDLMGQMDNSYMTEPINFPIGNPYTPEPSVRNNPFQQTQEPIGNPFGDFNPSQVDFGPPKPIQPMSVRAPQTNAPSSDFLAMLDALQKARPFETRASDRFNTLLDNVPQRQEPNFMSRLAGAGAYLGNKSRGIPGGYEAQEKAMYAPYYREMMDWTAKTAPFQQAATVENTGNVNERNLMGNFLTAEAAARRTEQQAIAARDREETIRTRDANNLKVQQERNAILQAKQNGAKFSVSGERVIAMFPDGTTRDAGPTTNWSPFELENLKQSGRMAVQGLENQGDLAVQGSRNQGALAVQNARPNPAMNPRNAGTIEQTAMRTEYATNLEARNWIKLNEDTGEFALVDPPVGDPAALGSWTRVARKVYPDQFPPEAPANVPYRGGIRPEGQAPSVPNIPPNMPGVPNIPPPAGRGGMPQQGGPTTAVPTPSKGGAPSPQQQAGIANGTLLEVYNPRTGERGTIQNTQSEIEAAVRAKLQVSTSRAGGG